MKVFRLLRKALVEILRVVLRLVVGVYRAIKHFREWWRFQKSLTWSEMFSKKRYNQRLDTEDIDSISRATTYRGHRVTKKARKTTNRPTLDPAAVITVFNNAKPRNHNACISCGTVLKSQLNSPMNCPACGTELYLEPGNTLFNSDLLTKDDLAAVKFHDYLLKSGGNFEISITTYRQLSKSRQRQDTQEILRHIMNSTLDKLRSSAQSQIEVKYFESTLFMAYARYLYEIDLNPAAWIEGAKRREYEIILMRHRFESKGAYIDSSACCSECAKYHGIFFEKEKILTGQAIPFSVCKNRPIPSSTHPFCEAGYSRTLPRSLLLQKISNFIS